MKHLLGVCDAIILKKPTLIQHQFINKSADGKFIIHLRIKRQLLLHHAFIVRFLYPFSL